jgi:hypothetical protein
MDFNLSLCSELLISLKNNHKHILSYASYVQEKPTGKFTILRHDIDKNPQNALKIARIEHEIGIHGTYYFRIHPSVFKPSIIREIAGLGHEIGYHYEDYTNNNADPIKAIASFQKNLEEFRKIVPVKTICMDGHPISKYNNLDLWKYYDYKDFGIECEPYLDFNFNKILYLSDTGRGWNLIEYSVWDKVRNPFDYHNKTTHELIKDLEEGKLPDQIMITIHPQRWHENPLPWLRELVLQRLKNIVKWGLIWMRKNK